MKFRLLKRCTDGFKLIRDLDNEQTNDVIKIKIKTHLMSHEYLCDLTIHVREDGLFEILSDELMFKPSFSGMKLHYNGVIKASHNSDKVSD
ncbi:MAG: hypothetical protein AABY07_08745 [Nanoarchaeota archaeon]